MNSLEQEKLKNAAFMDERANQLYNTLIPPNPKKPHFTTAIPEMNLPKLKNRET